MMSPSLKPIATCTTARLILNELSLNDAAFIFELVNTDEWKKFIGDRNIHTEQDAKTYIQKIIDNPNVNYWVVKTKGQEIPIGIITFIKRDYLEHHDIGFAFLARYTKQGYAYEATVAVLKEVIKDSSHTHVLATILEENVSSIQLLEKLGFRFRNKIQEGNDLLQVYAVATDKLHAHIAHSAWKE